MRRYSRALRNRPVQSEKHEITWSNLAQDFATTPLEVVLVEGKTLGATSADNEVQIGAQVRGIYLEFNIGVNTVTSAKVVHWKVAKKPFATTISAANTYHQADKRFIFRRGMEMFNPGASSAGILFKRIIYVPIPPRYRRIGDGDEIVLMLEASSTETMSCCGFAIYKHFT